jgi:hypothetical protein
MPPRYRAPVQAKGLSQFRLATKAADQGGVELGLVAHAHMIDGK